MKEALLSVDLDAALAKLALGRLPGPHHAAVALARWAAAAHPSRLALAVGRGWLELEHDGAPPQAEALEILGRAVDRCAPEDVRRRALDDLEAHDLLDLLVAFVLPAREARLVAGAPTGRTLHARGGAIRLEVTADREKVRLRLDGLRTPTAGWARTAAEHLAHARFRTEVDGRRVDRGLELPDVVAAVTLRRGDLIAVVGIPRRGNAARTRVLEHGVLRREVWGSPAGGQVWDALVDGPPRPERVSLGLAAEAAARLVHEARAAYPRLAAADRQRLVHLLFRLADGGEGAAAVAGVPLFRAVGGAAYRAEDLPALAVGGVVRALGPEARPEQFRLDGVVLVLGEEERAFVERHLGLRAREPARRPAPPGLSRRLRRALSEVRDRLARAARQRLLSQRAVPEHELEPIEVGMAAALERALAEGLLPGREGTRVSYCRGRLVAAAWERGRHGARLWLGRGHPRVREMLHAWRRDPRRLYAVLMALADGADAFGRERSEAVARLTGMG